MIWVSELSRLYQSVRDWPWDPHSTLTHTSFALTQNRRRKDIFWDIKRELIWSLDTLPRSSRDACTDGSWAIIPRLYGIVRIIFVVLANHFWCFQQLSKCHLQSHKTISLLHIPDILCRKLSTKLYMGKDVQDIGLNCHILIYHCYLLSIKYKFPLVNIDSLPKRLNIVSYLLTHFCNTV